MFSSQEWWNGGAESPSPSPAKPIGQSLRFRGAQKLESGLFGSSNTFGPNWTISFWVKFAGPINTTRQIIATGLRSGGGNYVIIDINDGVEGQLQTYGGSVTHTYNGRKLRDPSAWYHFVLNNDELYINGEAQGAPAGYWSNFDGCDQFGFSNWEGSPNSRATMYVADAYLVQQTLGPEVFGTQDDNGVWVPAETNFSIAQSKYSDFLTATRGSIEGSGPGFATNAFDGDLDANTGRCYTSPDGELTWAPVPGVSFESTFEIYNTNTSGEQEITWNGNTIDPTGGWTTVATGSGTIDASNPLVISALNSANRGELNAVRLDGEILTDPYLWSQQLFTSPGYGNIDYTSTEKNFQGGSPVENGFDNQFNTFVQCDSNSSWFFKPQGLTATKIEIQLTNAYGDPTGGAFEFNGVEQTGFPGQSWYTVYEGVPISDWTLGGWYRPDGGNGFSAIRVDGVILEDGFNPSYGPNGVHLDFSDPNDIGADRSGNGNDFTATGFDTAPVGIFSEQLFTSTKSAIDFDSTSTDFPPASGTGYAFDGDLALATQTVATSDSSVIFRPSAPFTNVTQIRVHTAGTPNCEHGYNGANVTPAVANGTWSTVYSGPPITVDNIFTQSDAKCVISAYEINGTILVDNTGSNYDLMLDSPTQNWATGNPLQVNAYTGTVLTDANLTWPNSAVSQRSTTIPISDGNWYFEYTIGSGSASDIYPQIQFQGIGTYYQGKLGIGPQKYFETGVTADWTTRTAQLVAGETARVTYESSTGTVTVTNEAGETWTHVWSSGAPGGIYADVNGTETPAVGVAINTGVPGVSINFGQQPFLHPIPEGYLPLQTQNLPKSTIPNGRDQFQAITAATVNITGVNKLSDGNYTITYHMGNDGTGATPTDGYTTNINNPDPNASSNEILVNPAIAINDSCVNGTGFNSGNGGSKGTVHSTKILFDPPLTGPIEFQCSVGTGANQNSFIINGIGQDTSAMNGDEKPYQTFNDDVSSLVLYGASATYNTWGGFKTVNGVATGGFIDNLYEITVSDGGFFSIGQIITNSAGSIGYITDIQGDVLTVESPSEDGWTVGSGIDLGLSLIEFAQQTFPSGLWWIKDRVNSNQHQLVDSVRNAVDPGYAFYCPTYADNTNYVAPTGDSVAWCWNYNDANPSINGFSIRQFTTTGASNQVFHGLGKAPEFIIMKGAETSIGWYVYHKDLDPGHYLLLHANFLQDQDTRVFAQVNDDDCYLLDTFNAGLDNQAYLWTSVPGYSAFGSYVGNGDPDGVFVHTGMKPAFVMTKCISTASDWLILDTTREVNNPSTQGLLPNETMGELALSGGGVDILSNGFKARQTGSFINDSQTYIYCCFAENPFSYPVTAR